MERALIVLLYVGSVAIVVVCIAVIALGVVALRDYRKSKRGAERISKNVEQIKDHIKARARSSARFS